MKMLECAVAFLLSHTWLIHSSKKIIFRCYGDFIEMPHKSCFLWRKCHQLSCIESVFMFSSWLRRITVSGERCPTHICATTEHSLPAMITLSSATVVPALQDKEKLFFGSRTAGDSFEKIQSSEFTTTLQNLKRNVSASLERRMSTGTKSVSSFSNLGVKKAWLFISWWKQLVGFFLLEAHKYQR